MNKILYIFDLDHTISDGRERLLKAGAEPSRSCKATYNAWVEKINAGMENDKPVSGMQMLVGDLDFLSKASPGTAKVYILTSREERHRLATSSWLKEHGFDYSGLIMRPDDNYDDMHIFKESRIKKLVEIEEASSVIVFDDDHHGTLEKVCDRNGWTFFKARSGGVLK